MDLSFGEYLERGTQKILEIVSSTSVSDEERDTIIEAYTAELSNNIGNTSKLKDYELLACEASLKHIDEKISEILANTNSKYDDYATAISLCERQKSLIDEFHSKGWSLKDIANTNVDSCIDELRKRQDSTSLTNKIIEEDHQITYLIQQAQQDLSVKTCESANEVIDSFERNLELAKAKKTKIASIENKDIKKARKKVEDIRTVAEKKEAVHQQLYDIDGQLYNKISTDTGNIELWHEILDFCKKESDLLNECRKNNYPLPSLKCDNPDGLEAKYSHYIEMRKLDDKIVSERDSLVTNKQYKAFYSNCDKQKQNIEVCNRNGWSIPLLTNNNPDELLNTVHIEKRKKDNSRKWKNRFILVGASVLCVGALVLFAIYKYREGKVQIPFDPEFVAEENYKDIHDELTSAGFTNVVERADNGGWLESGKVISVSIDYSDSYSKGTYCKPDVNVVITYSSLERKDATAVMENWQTKKYDQLQKSLKAEGFTNITLNKVSTTDSTKHHLVSDISINNENFVDGDCFIQSAAPIKIDYYVYTIAIGEAASSIEGSQYTDVVKSLKEKGFTNIKLLRANNLINGWITKEGSIKGIAIDEKDDFEETDKFACDSEIVIIVNTFKNKGCKDITEVAD